MDRLNKKIIKISGILFIVFIVFMVILSGYFYIEMLPVDPDSETNISFTIDSGTGKNEIINNLKKEGLIKDSTALKLYVKFFDNEDFYAGTYALSKSMNSLAIIDVLSNGNSMENESISVTFVEGKRFPYYVNKISENFNYTEEEIYNTINEEFLNKLIEKYWFIDESVLNSELYYPLEGYVFPDTYEFKKSATIEEILDKMIGELGTKLENYKEDIELSNYSVHSLLTLASVVELEAVTAEDRGLVAGVLYNRLNNGISLGCDVTTYYGAKVEVGARVNTEKCNAYNTRGNCVKGLPVGPIASPSLTSIVSAINPTKNDYYFFVADTNNKVYFAVDNVGHLKNKKDLCNKGIWPDNNC